MIKIDRKKGILFILLLINTVVLVSCTLVEKPSVTMYSSGTEIDNRINSHPSHPVKKIRVATLNLAHGRKDSLNQMFVSTSTIKENLDDIAKSINRYKPHVVAFQEADAASLWSGSFDHVEHIALKAQYSWRVQVSNAQSWLFSYGTAIMSLLPITETIKHTFSSSPPTPEKGFVLAQITAPCHDGVKLCNVDVISVHLDFSNKSVRIDQVKEMREVLSARSNPTIILGDFNSEWMTEGSAFNQLETDSRFYTYKPESADYNSYKNKRLDWILISKDMEFIDYRVVDENLSDHAMVIADIRFKK